MEQKQQEQLEKQVVRRHFVLHSGGIDSTTALAMALFDDDVGGEVVSVSMFYGQRHKKEVTAAGDIARHYSIPHHIWQLGEQPKSMLTDDSIKVPNISYGDIKGMSPTYVPFRNGQLLSRIAAIAQAWVMEELTVNTVREANIWFGAHAEDAQNWAYPDCTPEFIGAMANAIYIGTYHKVRLITPFTFMTKAQIIQQGDQLNVPWALTWSCYKGEEMHCGICPTCRARRIAFEDAGVIDPTEYAATPIN